MNMGKNGIYLDNAATTQIDKSVLTEMRLVQGRYFGNASSLHRLGVDSARHIEKSRFTIARAINADWEEVIFTSGGTESNNFALKGLAFANKRKQDHLITSKIEHPSVIEPARWLRKRGFRVTFLDIDNNGFVDPQDIRKAITKKTLLVSVMYANNEVGTIEPIEEIGRICRDRGVLFHTDACQAFLKEKIDVRMLNIDLATLNAHKIHGPKGAGALYVRKGIRIDSLLHGGVQERNMRAGTYNTESIVGFAKAVEITDNIDAIRMRELRNYCLNKIRRDIDDVVINGPEKERLCNNINISFNGVLGKDLMAGLSRKNIFISTGSACTSDNLTPSHVLTAMGISPQTALGAIRISLSKWTSHKEIDVLIDNLKKLIRRERLKKP
ncbi:MAG TPA: cysteine desulfurase NifS [Candidatus Omnitrophica bacterium]|nr:cysteine desulfurase NifS [Candidatus Omnitrophota bacterium]